MTKRQGSMLAVLIVVAIGFVVDRLFLDDPQAAEARPTPRPAKTNQSAPTRKPPSAAPAPAPVVTDPSLAWLERLADSRPDRDVFAPSPAWIKAQKEAVEKAKEQAEARGPLPGSPQAFQLAHRLQATTVMGRGGLAVVDGECLSLGDSLDDFQLVGVTAGEAEFRRGRDRAILRLPMGPAPTAKPSPISRPSNQHTPSTATPAASTQPTQEPSFFRRLWGRR